MSKLRGIHYVAPASMLGALAAGILFAVGHHLFYSKLNGTSASESLILGSISYQEANIAIGTAFGYLVTSFLGFAAATAFVQVFWKEDNALHKAPLTLIKHLDSIYSAPNNLVTLFKIPLWPRYPCLFILATIVWVIPIASIITPATLSVRSAPVDPPRISPEQVPNLDFPTLDLVDYMPLNTNDKKPASYYYIGPHSAVMTVATAAMSQGSILQIPSPRGNASWNLEFSGPSLKCENVGDDAKFRFLDNIIEAYNPNNLSGTPQLWFPLYLAWLPSSAWHPVSALPFPYVKHKRNSTRNPHVITSSKVQDNPAELTLYLMTIPNTMELLNWPHPSNISTTMKKAKERYTGTAIACRIYDSTYRVSFKYREGVQSVSIKVPHVEAAPQKSPIYVLTGPELVWHPPSNHSAGYNTYIRPEICPSPNGPPPPNEPPPQNTCGRVDRTLLRSLSYQAVFDAFSQNIIGLIEDVFNTADVRIKDTALINNKQLRYLRQQGTIFGPSLQDTISSFNETNVMGMANQVRPDSDKPLGEAMEEMFQNVTVSLMSSPLLQPNYSSITAPPPAQVTYHHYHNIYSYSMWKLWVAYGTAILLTIVAVVTGFAAMLLNGASYSDDFSTILRASKGAYIDTQIQDSDLVGRDPIRKDLANAGIRFRRRQNRH